jgi:hypothetical protein
MTKAWMAVLVVALLGGTRFKDAPPRHSYLFVWAGDSALKSHDFLAVIDADRSSPDYGRVLASVPTDGTGTPHHTEAQLASDGHLLANDFTLGRTWLFDVNEPLHPHVIASFDDIAGFSHPHTFARLADGNVLATFQYRATITRGTRSVTTGMRGMPEMKTGAGGPHSTGGLVEMNERGNPVHARSAADPATGDTLLYPYSALPIAGLDRIVSTTTDMNLGDSAATSRWIQIWRLSDLKLLRSIELPPGPHGDENRYTGEARLLPDGRSVYIHTFNCGVYLLRDIATDRPSVKFVHRFEGTECGVPVLTSHYWLQTVPAAHALVAMDIRDPEHPREVSRAVMGATEYPHWAAIDASGRRVVVNSAGHGSRLFVIDFDPATGALAVDRRFRDAGSGVPGVSMSNRAWPHGFTGTAVPHGSVFSR